jgi:hypothetical protein
VGLYVGAAEAPGAAIGPGRRHHFASKVQPGIAAIEQFAVMAPAIFEDPFGHRRPVAAHLRDTSPAEMQEAMQKMGG